MTATLPALAPDAFCQVVDLGCQTQSAFHGIITEVAHGAAQLVVSMTGWWTTTSSIDPTDPAVVAAQGGTRPLILIILVASVLVQSIRIIVSRKSEPLIMVVTGLLRYAAVSALGLAVLQAALKAGDELASQLLDNAVDNYARLMQHILIDANASFVVLLMSLIAAVLSLVQWVLMAMRQAGLLVLAAMLPLAASGSLNRATRGWLDRLLSWMLAMVAYKPAAAFIYYVGYSYLSTVAAPAGPGDLATMITGLMVLLLAVVAMPVLLKLFAWSGTQVGGGNGGGSGFLGAAGAVAMSQGYGRSGSVGRAAAMESSGPGSATTAGQYAAPAGAAPAAGAQVAGTQAAGTQAAGASSGAAAAAGPAGVAVAAGLAARSAAHGAAGRMTADPDGGGPA